MCVTISNSLKDMQSCPRGQRGLTDQQRCVGRGIHYVTSDAQQLGVINVALTVLTVQPTGQRPFGSASWPTTASSPFVPHSASFCQRPVSHRLHFMSTRSYKKSFRFFFGFGTDKFNCWLTDVGLRSSYTRCRCRAKGGTREKAKVYRKITTSGSVVRTDSTWAYLMLRVN